MMELAKKLCGAGVVALLVSAGLVSAQTKIHARVVSEVRDDQRVALSGNARIASIATADLGAASGDLALNKMILLLKPNAAQQAELTQLTEDQVNPQSPNYHKWLTPVEFAARFGVADADIMQVTQWLMSQGFTVDEVPAGHQLIIFSGTNGQLTSAFHTTLHHYQLSSSTRLANDADPQIPAALAPVISGVFSLNDAPRVPAHRDLGSFTWNKGTNEITPKSLATGTPVTVSAQTKTSGSGNVQPEFSTTIGTANYKIVSPYDFATIYDLTTLWTQGYDGTGQTIAIISPSDLNLTDVDNFRAQFGLPAKKVNKIFVGANPGITSNVAETALDVEWSGAVAKGATIDLVVAGSTATTEGVDLAALYIVNSNLAPVLSMSYGECEYYLGASGNAFYNSLWQQAAAQGQSVFISSGDAGSATCDQGGYYSYLGLTVNGLASTPYNVSVGGTDLYGTYSSPSTYWSNTNNPTTLASALTYVPEIPWNDSCGNPLLLKAEQTLKGYTDASTAAFCNNSKEISTSNFRNIVGGGGGVSNCIATTNGTITTCTGGYAKPSWQTGTGVPADNARDVPDVSLFSGDGLWGSFYPYCLAQSNNDDSCNMSVSTDIQGAGGTSFASPAFAGILAIVNQKTASIQGNPNPIFYKLASSQSALSCSSIGTSNPSTCIFHDVDTAGNAGPCYNYGGAKDCTVSVAGNTFGVVNGFAAGKGYDLATGLGSVDITNLVNAWPTAVASQAVTTTTMKLSSTSFVYGAAPTATIAVTSTAGTPTGLFSVLPSSTASSATIDGPGMLSGGSGTLALPDLPVGAYTVHAHYAGDTGFASSDSAAQSVTVAQAATTLASSASRTSVAVGQSSNLTLTVGAAGSGLAPTGTVQVVNSTMGVTLGSYTLAANSTGVASSAVVNISSTLLDGGSNSLSITYSGDSNYLASSATQALTMAAPLALSLSANSITVTTSATITSATSAITLAAANSGTLAYPITLSCTGILPTGSSCALSSTVLASPVTTAVATVNFDPSATTVASAPHTGENPANPCNNIGMISVAGLVIFLGFRRRRIAPSMLMVCMTVGLLLGLEGCGGNSSPAPSFGVTLSASASSATLGNKVTFTGAVTGSGSFNGTMALTDTYHGSTRSAGSMTVASGQGGLTTSALGLGPHSIVGVYTNASGDLSGVSAPVSIAVTTSSTLQITAVDAHGYTVTAPLLVNFQ